MEYEHIIHPIPPFYDASSKVLILGSFPSVKSRESGFFYGHPQNRFWKVLAGLFGEEIPGTVDEKKKQLAVHHLAVWDSINSCDIIGSSDSSILNAQPNDFSKILSSAQIRQIFTNGKKSHEIYMKYCYPRTKMADICLPSTSPANAAWRLPELIKAWKVLKDYL